jgi:predicted dehydrogenase
VRCGLFGTGHWARATQGAALAGHPGVELVGVWGRDPVRAAALAADLGARPYADVDALIADVDLVSIALPPDIQAGIATRAATAGRHLLLDKPLALTVADADAVVDAVDRAGVASVVFFTARFLPGVAAFLRSGVEWDAARFAMYGSIFQPGNPYGGSGWRREKGGLWDLGPHALALALPVFGPAGDVVAMRGRHDTTYVLVRHGSGAVSQLELTLDAPAVHFQTQFFGPAGPVDLPADPTPSVVAFGIAIDELLATVAAGATAHPCDVRFARDVVAVLARAEHAAGGLAG